MSELRIDPDKANSMDDVLFVDARNAQAWSKAKTKLPGAVRVPADALESHIDELPKDRAIITYCTWPEEASSASLAQQMISKGFSDVRALRGGFDAWVDQGYPVEPK